MNKSIAILIVLLLLIQGCFMSRETRHITLTHIPSDLSSQTYNEGFNDIRITVIDEDPDNYYFEVLSEPDSANIIDLGNETFNFIDRAPSVSQMDSSPARIYRGHLYIVKCLDGYAKLKVASISGSYIYDIEISAYYEFSADSVF
ncbi:MAG: hypothetical protein SVK54_07745 [candidate division WOR-3 bacterium]|nr:hypothetical protein [candidate division WOR-3 bacterium]